MLGVVALLCAPLGGRVQADEASAAVTPGATVFTARCAVCHGPQAGGIPGTFPALHDQIAAFARTPQGRDYLVMVVSSGLMGELTVDGVHYNNVMPAQSGLTDADVAAVLNYVAGELGKRDLGSAAVTPDEVRDARARHPQNTPQGSRALRPASAVTPPGVANAQRAWQNWTLNCQGCHRPDGSGSAGTTPSLKGTTARFLAVPQGREYLNRVPGVATSPLSDADLAEVMNWMLWRFDEEHVPPGFSPFTAAEVGQLRRRPLRLEASQVRAQLLAQAEALQPQ